MSTQGAAELRLERARTGDPTAMGECFADYYPEVYRIAATQLGRPGSGEVVAKRVMKQATLAVSRWRHVDDARRWFRHHTLLGARDQHQARVGDNDLLLGRDDQPEPEPDYRGFLIAIRYLPSQQREALLLHHGEGLDIRQLGIAMDCSVEAAEKHLLAAQQRLVMFNRSRYPTLLAMMVDRYRDVQPDGPLAIKLPRPSRMRRMAWRVRRLLPLVGVLAILGLIALLVLAGALLYPRLVV